MPCSAMANAFWKEDSRFWWPILLAFTMASTRALSQSTNALDFLSISCGIESDSSYVNPLTNISYISDIDCIDTDVNHNISGDILFPNSTPSMSSPMALANDTSFSRRQWQGIQVSDD
ncbi:hypothetical protein ZIOFF_012623 [Zingiber officinale]|uniref:Malectin-like domain-containing protein n=1 Tax=Zingiber officinale TaxID=94328 RepID=A0A8J5HSM8_ZINOF|nr:hypothetical protein ZIOFF_012623 [Zingiber officinale]